MNKLISSFIVLFAAVFTVYLSGQAVYAEKKGSTAEVVYNDGTIGLSRTSEASTLSQGKAAKPLLAETPILNFHTAYPSYTEEYNGDSCWSFLCPDNVFLFGAFSTIQGSTKGVRVHWKIRNVDVPVVYKTVQLSHDFTDIVVTPDDFWNAWLHIEGLVPGHYVATITVESLENYGKKSAKCSFTVISCE